MKMTMKQIGSMAFYVKTPSGHDVYFDASPNVGGMDSAPRPMEMVLAALIGCTSMDVVSILRKMKVENYTYEITASSEAAEEYPKVFTAIHLKYIFKGKELPHDKIEKAVKLSQERYCPISAMLGQVAKLTYEIVYEEE